VEIKEAIFKQDIPLCTVCEAAANKGKHRKEDDDDSDNGEFPSYIMKVFTLQSLRVGLQQVALTLAPLQPDITFFGEKLTDDFEKCLVEDRDVVDLLIIIGTSLQVSNSLFIIN
jgi:NAD-dependent SIR2 family protein deacetylase